MQNTLYTHTHIDGKARCVCAFEVFIASNNQNKINRKQKIGRGKMKQNARLQSDILTVARME